ncbi:High mobility group-T protein [Smittium culicis]|uniref:High mobility group-T protein n=2 Tax=Smittium culicis TaxID=133412 RepID=A0A1R1X5B2_9FUNG|nr:High mobility group-T protein [Smittium culicis]OMJ12169.1 High mobility group-T protein [Smittium culicis]
MGIDTIPSKSTRRIKKPRLPENKLNSNESLLSASNKRLSETSELDRAGKDLTISLYYFFSYYQASSLLDDDSDSNSVIPLSILAEEKHSVDNDQQPDAKEADSSIKFHPKKSRKPRKLEDKTPLSNKHTTNDDYPIANSDIPPSDKKKKAEKDPNAPKRPANAFVMYCQEERVNTKAANADATNAEITKQMNSKWKELPPHEKKKYYTKYENLKHEYNKNMSQYLESFSKPLSTPTNNDNSPKSTTSPGPIPSSRNLDMNEDLSPSEYDDNNLNEYDQNSIPNSTENNSLQNSPISNKSQDSQLDVTPIEIDPEQQSVDMPIDAEHEEPDNSSNSDSTQKPPNTTKDTDSNENINVDDTNSISDNQDSISSSENNEFTLDSSNANTNLASNSQQSPLVS